MSALGAVHHHTLVLIRRACAMNCPHIVNHGPRPADSTPCDTVRQTKTAGGALVSLLDAQALLHCVALIPNVNVIASQLRRPLWRKSIYARRSYPIDIVVEASPRIVSVQRI